MLFHTFRRPIFTATWPTTPAIIDYLLSAWDITIEHPSTEQIGHIPVVSIFRDGLYYVGILKTDQNVVGVLDLLSRLQYILLQYFQVASEPVLRDNFATVAMVFFTIFLFQVEFSRIDCGRVSG